VASVGEMNVMACAGFVCEYSPHVVTVYGSVAKMNFFSVTEPGTCATRMCCVASSSERLFL
jgi:hypothetical protein